MAFKLLVAVGMFLLVLVYTKPNPQPDPDINVNVAVHIGIDDCCPGNCCPNDDSMVSAEPLFVPTEVPFIPTNAPFISTEAPSTVTTNGDSDSNSDTDSDSDSDCNYSAKFGESHTMNLPKNQECGEFSKTGVTAEERTSILHKHNTLRQKVATGRQSGQYPQPGATNMLEMQWNTQLAEVAQAWAEQCNIHYTVQYDAFADRKICNNDYTVGQNSAFHRDNNNPAQVWNTAIVSWYSQVKYITRTLVQEFASVPNPVSSLYAQVVWAETYEVGCGAIHYESTWEGKNWDQTKYYVCNYGPAGALPGQPIYEIDETANGTGAATNCPNGPSSNYTGLCATPISS